MAVKSLRSRKEGASEGRLPPEFDRHDYEVAFSFLICESARYLIFQPYVRCRMIPGTVSVLLCSHQHPELAVHLAMPLIVTNVE